METFLFDKIIFGPVRSRRLGISLGINLLPLNRKYCNFDCIYCECGFNDANKRVAIKLPSLQEVMVELEGILKGMHERNDRIDVITFAGNGEPTMHPDFAAIISGTLSLRDKYFPKAKVSVLSNATLVHKRKVFTALQKVDQNILKLDSVFMKTLNILNRPVGKIDLDQLKSYFKAFNGNFIIQTMFVRGHLENGYVDNTTTAELNAWEAYIKDIGPKQVMIYTIDRNTPMDGLEKIPLSELNEIARRIELLNIEVQVSA